MSASSTPTSTSASSHCCAKHKHFKPTRLDQLTPHQLSSYAATTTDSDSFHPSATAIEEEEHEGDDAAAVSISATCDPSTLLQRFLSLQSERAEAYTIFESEFRNYLQTHEQEGTDRHFAEICGQVTKKFHSLSSSIRSVISSLLPSSSHWAEQINKLQGFEKQKLQTTIELQLLQTQYRVTSDDEYNSEFITQKQRLKQQLAECVNNINEIIEQIRMDVIYGEGEG